MNTNLFNHIHSHNTSFSAYYIASKLAKIEKCTILKHIPTFHNYFAIVSFSINKRNFFRKNIQILIDKWLWRGTPRGCLPWNVRRKANFAKRLVFRVLMLSLSSSNYGCWWKVVLFGVWNIEVGHDFMLRIWVGCVELSIR